MLRLLTLKRSPLFTLRQMHKYKRHSLSPIAMEPPSIPKSTYPLAVFFSSAAATKNVAQESPQKMGPVLDLLKSYGFTDSQIKRFTPRAPTVYSTEIIKPKLEYLLHFGFSHSELIKVICYDPNIIGYSLMERLAPNLNVLKATLGSKAHVIKAIVHGPWLLRENLEKHVIPNVKILRESIVPMGKVIDLFTRYPRVLYMHSDVIIEAISKLKGLGMSLSNLAFIHGMSGMTTMKKETWERKMKLYQSFGWSEEDTLSAFSQYPTCMQYSEDKVTKTFKFFLEKLQWDSALILRRPVVLTYSLERRIIPRCAVLNVLAKNGLWNGKPTPYCVLNMGEKVFEKRFVEKYEKEVPQMIDAYQGKVEFTGFEQPILLNNHRPKISNSINFICIYQKMKMINTHLNSHNLQNYPFG